MNQPVTEIGKARSYSYMVLAVVFGCFVPSVHAAPGSGQFNVTATLQPASSPKSNANETGLINKSRQQIQNLCNQAGLFNTYPRAHGAGK